MSAELWAAVGVAAWTGLLMAISPCPMATNIAAISFISRRVANPRAALATGLLYALGRSLVYVAIAWMLVSSLMSSPDVSVPLQKLMNKILGPTLILVGMVLLDLISLRPGGSGLAQRVGQRVADWGVWAGLALGIVFGLSFCPASAALYFASLVPLAIKFESRVLLPLVFAIGSAAPVVLFAVLIAFGANAVARAFDRVKVVEMWARRLTGVVFIVIGVYFSLAFIFEMVPAGRG
ncbi:MAG TPA: aromatic aminobenezylarsenical efflux permease ArsG family transporter [Phycisphaerae bacterium]|nr:aromatic aminobenezylarsenical efflux permease ArsG family transporter [Phycisphaerae bacterium]